VVLGSDMKRRVFKILALGKSTPLKSQLRQIHFQDSFHELHSNILGTGISIAKTMVDDLTIILQIWDISSHRRYSDVRHRLQRGSLGAFLIFDVNDRTSFESLPFWVESYFSNNNYLSGLVLVGLRDQNRKINNNISEEEANRYASYLSDLIGHQVNYVEIDLTTEVQPDLIKIMAETIIEPLTALPHESINISQDIKRLDVENLKLLLDHHILIRESNLEIFDSSDITNLIELIMRDHSPEIILRAILKVQSIEILSTLRLLLDTSYQPILQVKMQELIDEQNKLKEEEFIRKP
jgi:GTPase SAR1 family protein